VRIGFVPSFRFRWTAWTEKMRADSLAAFAKIPGVTVVAPAPSPDGLTVDPAKGLTPHGAVNTLDQAEAVADYFLRERVDAVVLCPLDFGDERSAAKVAERLRVPVLLYATKEPPAVDDASMQRVSDSYCGNLSMASGLYRRKLPFHYAGLFLPDEEAFLRELETFVRAVAVVKALKGARIGQVGVRPPTFETVGYSEAAMIDKFGQNVIYTNFSDIVDRALALEATEPRVQEAIARLCAATDTITVGDTYLLNSARMEVALAEFWEANRLSGMAIQCWPSVQRQIGISMCALFGRLTERQMLTACETDVLGVLAMIASHRAALGSSLPHFIDWTIQHRQDPNLLLAWHCGNAPVSLALPGCGVALRSRRDMKGEMEVSAHDPMAGLFQFQVRPGTVTFCRLAEYDHAWKMLIATGRIEPSDEVLAGTWSWVRVRDHAALYRTLVEEGFIHHASMIHGDYSEALLQACKFLDIEPVVVR